MAKEPYLVASLPFDSSPTYDECGNTWNVVGTTPSIIDVSSFYSVTGDKPFKKALFCQNGNIYTNKKILTFTKDFTISCWYLIFSKVNDDGGNNFIFDIYNLAISFKQMHGNPSPATALNYTEESTGLVLFEFPWDNTYNVFNKWCNIILCYVSSSKKLYLYLNGKLFKCCSISQLYFNYTNYPFSIGGRKLGDTASDGLLFKTGYIKHFKIYDGIAKWTSSTIDLKETYKAEEKYNITTKRNIYHLYNISYDSLYNYNINNSLSYNDIYRSILKDYMYDNDTYRDINKINSYNNTVYRSILRNYIYNDIIYRSILKDYMYDNDTYRDINKISEYNNDIYRSILRNYIYNNNTYRYIKRIDKYKNITKRNIKHDYMDILYNTKRLIHNNINIINYIYRKKVFSNNINNDTVRSVISWKHKIMVFVTNPRYKLR